MVKILTDEELEMLSRLNLTCSEEKEFNWITCKGCSSYNFCERLYNHIKSLSFRKKPDEDKLKKILNGDEENAKQ